jgi:curli production assembly/transport component CsgF
MKLFVWILTGCAVAGGVQASELVYTPINPTFGGNPLNASQLQYTATAQKPNPPAATTTSTQQSTAQQFLQMLQSQLYASLANSVSTAITGTNAQAAGTITLNNMQISWNTVGGQKTVTITDTSTGQITTISLPVVGS